MEAFFKLAADRRRDAFAEAEVRLGLNRSSVEKDLWICWTLRELFGLPDIGPHLFLKGGTSLSKAWRLIERFSEDIDIVIERSFLGFGGAASPERVPSRKQQRRRLQDLRAVCQKAILERIQPALADRIAATIPGSSEDVLILDPEDPDSQTLSFPYPSVLPASSYIRPMVKIEMGARSDTEPAETASIRSYLGEAFPEMPGIDGFSARVVAARRTFWEKSMLLHEETFRPPDKPRKARLARHYYELWCLITKGIAEQALADEGLFNRVRAHREVFFHWSWVDYSTLRSGSLRLVPPTEQRAAWAADYNAMRPEMFFGETPTFDEILSVVEDFERRLNKPYSPKC
jgi:hypothetical protein